MARNNTAANDALRGMRGQRAERRTQMLDRVFDKLGQEPRQRDPLPDLQREAADARREADLTRREAEAARR